MSRQQAIVGAGVIVWLAGFWWGITAQGWGRDTALLYVLAPIYVPLLCIAVLTVLAWGERLLRR